MSYCTQCGQSISDGARFCTNCGAQVARRTPSAPKPDLSGTEAAEQPSAPVGDPPDPFFRALLPAHAALLLCMPCFAFAVSEWNDPNAALDGRYFALMRSSTFLVALVFGIVSVLACFVFATMACKNLRLTGNSRRADSVAKWFRRSVWTLACLGFVGSSFSIYGYRPESSREEMAEAAWAKWAKIKKRKKQLKSFPSANAAAENILASMVDIPGKDFKMGKTEVTQAQWEAIMGENPSMFNYLDNPVEEVSWRDCQDFLEKLNALPTVKQSGLIFRLPSEEEWEYACRAGATGMYCKVANGTEITKRTLGRVAWFHGNSGGVLHPVGQKKPNAFGLYDMHGNVSEWTSTVDGFGDFKICGGGWYDWDWSCESSRRDSHSRTLRDFSLGFRLCAEHANNDERANQPSSPRFEGSRTGPASNGGRNAIQLHVEERRQGSHSNSSPGVESAVESILSSMVSIPGKNYKMGRTEVTQAQWEAIMGENPSDFKGENNPVEQVSWDDCQEFLKKLNMLSSVKKSGLAFRLPSVEEWEFACRAGSTGDYCRLSDGTEITESTLWQVAWFKDNSDNETHPVRQKRPNAFGLYDMHGNVEEWTSTAVGTSVGELCVFRGGCKVSQDWHCKSSGQSSGRHMFFPSLRVGSLGLRLCAEHANNDERANQPSSFPSANTAVESILASMVNIPGKDFKMGKFEVTQSQWKAIMGDNPSFFKNPDNPVEQVSWNDCQDFLKRLNALHAIKDSGLTFRLPTEEEWEYACRAGATGKYCKLANGTEITESTLGQVAWFIKAGGDVHPVGQKQPNAFGLYDMHGNVEEWTSTADGELRIFRGGSWADLAGACESSEQLWSLPWDRDEHLGFRLCAEDANNDERANQPSSFPSANTEVEGILSSMVDIPGKDFKLGKTEVTQAQWEAVMGSNPSMFKNPDNPVEQVSWDDCQEFLKKLNALPPVKKSRLTFRLPSEEEWEQTCRAGASGDYCCLADGTEITEATLGQVAWFHDNSDSKTHPVGQKKPNAFGLYDMHGNVQEWTSTADGADHYVFRGGSWFGSAETSSRFSISPSFRLNSLGFRLCAETRNGTVYNLAETIQKESKSKTDEITILTNVKTSIMLPGIMANRNPYQRGRALGKWGAGGGDATVMRALRWLKMQQKSDGSWGDEGQFRTALTGMAILTYLAHNETPAPDTEFGPTVERAIRFLCDSLGSGEYFRDKDGNNYSHPIGVYALGEAYAMTKNPLVKSAVERAVQPIIHGQNAYNGWDYKMVQTDRTDTIYTGWCVQAVKAVHASGIQVPGLDECYEKSKYAFDSVYCGGGQFGDHSENDTVSSGCFANTTVATFCMQLLGRYNDEKVKAALAFMNGCTYDFEHWDKQPWGESKENPSPIHYWYYLTQAKFQVGGATFGAWNKMFLPELQKRQQIIKGEGGASGYMDLNGKYRDIGWWDSPSRGEAFRSNKGGLVCTWYQGGAATQGATSLDCRIMDTTLCALQLMVYYRYKSVSQME